MKVYIVTTDGSSMQCHIKNSRTKKFVVALLCEQKTKIYFLLDFNMFCLWSIRVVQRPLRVGDLGWQVINHCTKSFSTYKYTQDNKISQARDLRSRTIWSKWKNVPHTTAECLFEILIQFCGHKMKTLSDTRKIVENFHRGNTHTNSGAIWHRNQQSLDVIQEKHFPFKRK